MRKKLTTLAALVLSALLALSSCSGQQTQTPAQTTAQTQEQAPEPANSAEPAQAQTDEPTATSEQPAAPEQSAQTSDDDEKSIIERSVLTTGNTARAERFFERAAAGEELTVAYIGGSITEGIAVGADECWAKLSYDYLCESYPEAVFNYVNAGMSGTPSMLANIRCERDVLAPYGDPDMVFIEFAVNDSQDSVSKEAFESLVRRMLGLGSAPAVILLFMRTDSGYSCQKHMSAVGYHYGLPMISVNDALTCEIDAGRMSWSDYSDDGAHPHKAGNRLVADMINYLFDCFSSGKIYEGAEAGWDRANGDISAIEPLYGDAYVNTHLYDTKSLTAVSMGEYTTDRQTISQFPNGWTRKGGENLGISFSFPFKSLFIVYHCNKGTKYGTAEVSVDGEWVSEVKSSASDGWSNPVPRLVIKTSELKERTVDITMKEGMEDTYFGILAFGYTD